MAFAAVLFSLWANEPLKWRPLAGMEWDVPSEEIFNREFGGDYPNYPLKLRTFEPLN